MTTSNRRIIQYAVGFACLFVLCVSVKAQVNIETKRRLDSKSGWYSDIGLSLKYRSGNTDLLKFETSVRSDYLVGKYHTFGLLTFQQEKQGGKVYTDKGFVHLRGARSITEHLGVEIFTQKQFNESILLQDRNLVGGGLRVTALKQHVNTKGSTGLNLYLGIGAMWENETINDKEYGEIDTNIIRSTNYVSGIWQIDKRFTLIVTGYYQPYLQRFSDFRILSESRFEFRATERVSFNFRLHFRYDSEPPTGIEAPDLEIVNGLSYKF